MTLTDLSEGFRDVDQRRRVQAVIHDRLADDQEQQECRSLMRFWWQLSVPYQEVSMEQLHRNVREPKLDVIEELISAIRTSHDEVDAWIAAVQQAFPAVSGPSTLRQ
ncbi:hypothetical protein AB0D04_20315 [Streptomyces sp. NPDC048483]|uniref:hypothetical protein n=1 Tax=Streptomyces sp. NPDC048483 TaxID=3154927 RepID=UPI003445CACD